MDMMLALVSGSPRAVRMASDQARWFVPVGVWFSFVGWGACPEPDVDAGLDAGVEAGADAGVEAGADGRVAVGVQLGVTCGVDGATVGVALRRGAGLAFAFGEVGCDATLCGSFARW
jgi:hypothetical protein